VEIQPVVVGTAGHIDHGKSSLVRALTGIDPDRLKEERERGLTIDLGFANFALPDGRRVGIVDVPGHERFVRNMVAGATGIDLVVLVVAADDGVMPQTREHLAIMQLLGLERGLIALTKIDAVEPELVEIAVEDVREAVAGTFLADVPIFPLSSVTGAGLDAMREALFELCATASPRSPGGLFRMPIQRVFSAPGFGTVVTGIPLSGSALPGDELEVLPQGRRVKLRGAQAYGGSTDRVRAGHSSALNVTDIEHTAARRGDVIASPDAYRAGRLVAVRVEALGSLNRPIRDRTAVRFHCGTADPHGELVLLDVDELRPGGRALAQVRLAEPVVVAPGDRFVLRLLSPESTLGGGVVIEEGPHRLKRYKRFVLEGLESAERALDSEQARMLGALARRGSRGASVEELASDLKRPRDEVAAELTAAGEEQRVVAVAGGRRWLEAGELESALDALGVAVRAHFEEHPLRLLIEAAELRRRTGLDKAALEPLLEVAQERGTCRSCGGGNWRFDGYAPQLSPKEVSSLDRLVRLHEEGGMQPPSAAECAQDSGLDAPGVDALLARLVDEGRLVRVAPGMHFASGAYEQALAAVRENCQRNGELSIPELRESLGSTRKWLIPLLEHLDAVGFTMRQGAHRVLRAR
jgi:selenocysteine-specific elongation factor